MATKKTSEAAKKTTTKKQTPSTKKTTKTTKAAKSSSPRSFKIHDENVDFMKPAFTIETIYWIVLSMAVIALGFWIATLQMRINSIYDQIEENQAQSENIEVQLKTQERLKARAADPAAE